MENLINDDFAAWDRRQFLEQRRWEKSLDGQMGALGLVAINGIAWFYPLSTLGIV